VLSAKKWRSGPFVKKNGKACSFGTNGEGASNPVGN